MTATMNLNTSLNQHYYDSRHSLNALFLFFLFFDTQRNVFGTFKINYLLPKMLENYDTTFYISVFHALVVVGGHHHSSNST